MPKELGRIETLRELELFGNELTGKPKHLMRRTLYLSHWSRVYHGRIRSTVLCRVRRPFMLLQKGKDEMRPPLPGKSPTGYDSDGGKCAPSHHTRSFVIPYWSWVTDRSVPQCVQLLLLGRIFVTVCCCNAPPADPRSEAASVTS